MMFIHPCKPDPNGFPQPHFEKEEYDTLKRQFEALIWLSTYEIKPRFSGRAELEFKGLPDAFRDYFLKRAPDPNNASGMSYWHSCKAGTDDVKNVEEKKLTSGQHDRIVYFAASKFKKDLPKYTQALSEAVKHVTLMEAQKQK